MAPSQSERQSQGGAAEQQKKKAEPSLGNIEHFTFALSVIDTRAGSKEGREHEKVLGFVPGSVSEETKDGIVGLACALTQFSSNFSNEEDDPFVVMEGQHNVWALFRCEPGIWMMMVVSKAWVGWSCAQVALRNLMTTLYSLVLLLHGPIQLALSQADALNQVRNNLRPLLDEMSRLLLVQGPRLRLASAPAPLTREAANLVNPLGLHCGVPLLVIPRVPFLGAQSLAGQLLNALRPPIGATGNDTGSRPAGMPVQGVQLSWHGMPIWSDLSTQDAFAVHALSQRALVPAAGIGRKKPNTLKAALVAAANATSTSLLPSSPSMSIPLPSEPPTDTLLSPANWACIQPNSQPRQLTRSTSDILPTPFNAHGKQQAYSTPAKSGSMRIPPPAAGQLKGPDQLPVNQAWSWVCARPDGQAGLGEGEIQGGPVTTTKVWMQAHNGPAQLLVFHYKALLVCIIIRDGVSLDDHLLAALSKVLLDHCPKLVSQLAESLPPSSSLWHQKGYRYSHEDTAASCTRATPIKKMTTLSDSTLLLAAHVRDMMWQWDRVTAAAADLDVDEDEDEGGEVAGGDAQGQPCGYLPLADSGSSGDQEVVCRSAADAWVVARRSGSKCMYVTVDHMPIPTLVGAAAHVQKLCDELYPGYYMESR